MSENISNELPVITDIADLPESAIEELTSGNDAKEITKSSTKSSTKSAKVAEPQGEVAENAPAEEKSEEVPVEEVKPKRKRKTKAETEKADSVGEVAKDE